MRMFTLELVRLEMYRSIAGTVMQMYQTLTTIFTTYSAEIQVVVVLSVYGQTTCHSKKGYM